MLAALLGGLILLGLAWYAGTLLARLKRQHDSQQQAIAARNERILECQGDSPCGTGWSVRLLRGRHPVDQSAGCVADQGGRAFAGEFPGLYGLYEKVKEMPTHEARRALKRNEVMKMDLERSGYEAELEAQILEDVARLKDFQLSR